MGNKKSNFSQLATRKSQITNFLSFPEPWNCVLNVCILPFGQALLDCNSQASIISMSKSVWTSLGYFDSFVLALHGQSSNKPTPKKRKQGKTVSWPKWFYFQGKDISIHLSGLVEVKPQASRRVSASKSTLNC